MFLTVLFGGLAALLMIVSAVSWFRLRSIKLGLLCIAFCLFIGKAVLLLSGWLHQDLEAILIDVGVIILLYGSVVKS